MVLANAGSLGGSDRGVIVGLNLNMAPARFGILAAFALSANGLQPTSALAADSAAPTPQLASPGAANLNISPRRVIFDGAKRNEAVYVFNQGNAAVTVDVSLADNVMLPSGEIVPVEKAAEKGPEAAAIAGKLHSARAMILATPSRLTLPPGKGKTIRIRADIPDATAGASEYRTHLVVTSLPSADMGLTAEAAASAQPGVLVMRIQALFGLSIPLIVRSGGAGATATLGSVTLDRDLVPPPEGGPAQSVPVLALSLGRAGAASVYGNIEVRSAAAKGTKGAKAGELIGLIRGIAVYPEIDRRQVRVRLTRELRHGEALTTTFFVDDGKPGSELARTSFVVP